MFYGWNSIYITQVYVDPRPSDCDARRWPLLLSGAGRYRSIAQPLIVTSYRSTGQSDGRTDTNPTLRRLCINCSRSGQHQQAEPTANISAWARLSMYTTQSLLYYWYLGNLVATLWERTRGRPTHYANEQSIRLFVGRIQVCEVICNKNLQLSKLPSMRSPIAAISFFCYSWLYRPTVQSFGWQFLASVEISMPRVMLIHYLYFILTCFACE